MFGKNYSNNGSQDINVNTRIETWFSETGMISIGCWNNKLSLRFTPAAGKNEDGVTTYSKDKKASTALDLKNCEALLYGLRTKINPFLEDPNVEVGTHSKISVSMGALQKRNILTIDAEKLEKGYSVKIILHQGITDGNIGNPDTTYIYTLSNKECAINYDDVTGEIEDEILVPTEYYVFYNIVNNYISMLSLSYHGQRLSQAMSGQQNGAGNFQQNNQGFSAPPMNNGGYEAPSHSFNGFDDGLPFN